MKVSPPIRHRPKVLFDPPPRPLSGLGAARTIVGDFFEELTESVLGARRHVCSARYGYCPDLSIGSTYIECKGMGPQGSLLVYKGRIEKDLKFADAGNELVYLVWHHTAQPGKAATDQEVKESVLMGIQWCAAVPLHAIETMTLWQKPIRSSIGEYGGHTRREAYGMHYRIPKAKIEPWVLFRWDIDEGT